MDLEHNYTNSGLSTPQAIQDAEERTKAALKKAHLPGFLVRFLAKTIRMGLYCDGCGKTGHTSSKLVGDGMWEASGGWCHKADLDFCPSCRDNGKMDEAIAAGVRPLGAFRPIS